jgi:CheY-like chemotaxis protein
MGRILIVDDDVDVIRIVEKVLKVAAHEVFSAPNALKAMDMLNSSLFDLMITDANMPQFSGFDLVQTIKNNKKFSRMAVAMLTGLREKKDIEKAIRIGVDEYIVKPIDPMRLIEKVDALFKKKPPAPRPELVIDDDASLGQAVLSNAVRVTRITELGFVVRSPVEIGEGESIRLDSPIFKKMGARQAPPLKVMSCQKTARGDFELRVGFVGMSEGFYENMRAWIYEQTVQKRTAA